MIMKCKIENCDRKISTKEMCMKHYIFYHQRQKRGIPFDWPFGKHYHKRVYPSKEKKTCKFNGCDKITKTVKGYCTFHYSRLLHGIALDRPKGVKGELNHNWKGGVAYYPNHSAMKKNRLIKLKEAKGLCEICGKQANLVHHIDESKDNHNLDNLAVLCHKCHRLYHSHPVKTSKYIRLYGMTQKELAAKFNCTIEVIGSQHKKGMLEEVTRTGIMPKLLNTKYKRLYGLTVKQMAARLNCSEASITYYHKCGALQKALSIGRKPTSNCKYRRIYGLSMSEIAKKLSKQISQISYLHSSGQLKKMLESWIAAQKPMYFI